MADGSAQEQDTQQDAATQGDQGVVDPGGSVDASASADGQSEQDLWNDFDNQDRAAQDGTEAEAADSQSAADDSGDELEAAAGDGEAGDDAQSADGDKAADDKSAADAAEKAQKDIWSSAPEELRAAHEAAQKEIERLQQANRSNNSRVSALNRKLNEIRSRGSDATDKAASTGKGDQTAAKSLLDDPDLQEAAKEFPEVAKPFLKVIAALEERVNKQDARASVIDEDVANQAAADELAALEKEHSDWKEVAAEDGFGEWLNDQPRHIQQAAIDNAQKIVDAREAADVIGRYKAFRSAQANNGQQETPTDQKNGQESGNSLSDKRRRQLASSQTSRSRGPGAANGIPEDGDPEAIWKAFDRIDQQGSRSAVI